MKTVLVGLLLPLLLLTYAFDLTGGWYKAGTQSGSYDMDNVSGGGRDGKDAFTIKSNQTTISGYGSLVHDNNPGTLSGKRVRMTGYIKTQNVKGWAGLTLRVEKSGSSLPLVSDNMHDRSVKGTTAWTKCTIVVDIPATATKLVYGAMLNGTGQVWFESPNFEEVSSSVPVTAKPVQAATPASH